MSYTEKVQENRVRRIARRQGYSLFKSRERYVYPHSVTNYGEYMLVDEKAGVVLMGEKYHAKLDEIEEFLSNGREWQAGYLSSKKYLTKYPIETLPMTKPVMRHGPVVRNYFDGREAEFLDENGNVIKGENDE